MPNQDFKKLLQHLDTLLIKCENRIIWLKALTHHENSYKCRDIDDYRAHLKLYEHFTIQLSEYRNGIDDCYSNILRLLKHEKKYKYHRLKQKLFRVINGLDNEVECLKASILMEKLKENIHDINLGINIIPSIRRLQKIGNRLEKLRIYTHQF